MRPLGDGIKKELLSLSLLSEFRDFSVGKTVEMKEDKCRFCDLKLKTKEDEQENEELFSAAFSLSASLWCDIIDTKSIRVCGYPLNVPSY